MNENNNLLSKIHLIISVLIVVPTALIYGFKPELSFDIQLDTIDEHNLFKAIMGLYIGFSVLWMLGIFKSNFLKIAIITNVIFMLGLGSGRIMSILLDGTPTFSYIFGTIAELVLGLYGLWVLNKLYKPIF